MGRMFTGEEKGQRPSIGRMARSSERASLLLEPESLLEAVHDGRILVDDLRVWGGIGWIELRGSLD